MQKRYLYGEGGNFSSQCVAHFPHHIFSEKRVVFGLDNGLLFRENNGHI